MNSLVLSSLLLRESRGRGPWVSLLSPPPSYLRQLQSSSNPLSGSSRSGEESSETTLITVTKKTKDTQIQLVSYCSQNAAVQS